MSTDDVSQGTEYRWYLESMPVTNEPDIRRILDGIDARDAEIGRLRAKNRELNRRATIAEGAVRHRTVKPSRGGFGRALANAAAASWQMESDRWKATARRMAHDARSWRGQAETDAETVEELKARLEIQGAEIERWKATARRMAKEARARVAGAAEWIVHEYFEGNDCPPGLNGLGGDPCPPEFDVAGADETDCLGCWLHYAAKRTTP